MSAELLVGVVFRVLLPLTLTAGKIRRVLLGDSEVSGQSDGPHRAQEDTVSPGPHTPISHADRSIILRGEVTSNRTESY